MTYQKPLPLITRDNGPYWQAAKHHELRLPKCNHCGSWVYPIAPLCQECWSDDLVWTQLGGHGVVSSWVVYHRAFDPSFEADLPYMVVQVDLDEGVRLMSNLIDVQRGDVYAGMPVRVEFEDVTPDIALVKFRDARASR